MVYWLTLFWQDSNRASSVKKAKEASESNKDGIAYKFLLKNELLGDEIEDMKEQTEERKVSSPNICRNLFKVSRWNSSLNSSLIFSMIVPL